MSALLNTLKNDLQQIEAERDVMQERARIYAECGLKDKAEQFAEVVEKDEKLIKEYTAKIKQLEE